MLIAGGFLAAGAGTASAATGATVTPALTCTSQGCGDPVTTGCNQDGILVSPNLTAFGGGFDMWRSNTCGTNWAQYYVPDSSHDYVLSILGSTGRQTGIHSHGVAGWAYTDQVQSPGAASMCVEQWNLSDTYESGVSCWRQSS